MRNLLRADFFRIFKHKLSLVSLIIAVVFPVALAGIFFGLKKLLTFGDADVETDLGMLLNAHAVVSSTFSFTNNFGIVMPIFATIIIMADINSGTIRNKIILGYSRHKIFASHFLTSLVYCLVLMTVYAGMTVLWSVLFFGKGEITREHAMSLLYFFILGLLLFAMVSVICTSLSLLTFHNVGAIILTLVICMGLGLATSLISAFDYSKFEHVMHFIPTFVVNIFQMKEISLTMFIEALVGTVAFGGLFYILGTFGFARKDLK